MASWLLIPTVAVGVLALGLFATSLAWVWRDAERRGQPGFIVTVLVALLCWPVSLIVWLLARPALPGTPPAPGQGNRGCLVATVIAVVLVLLAVGAGILLMFFRFNSPTARAPLPGPRFHGGRGGDGVVLATNDEQRTACQAQLTRIVERYRQYVTRHGNAPKSLADLREYGLEDNDLRCPAARLDAGGSYRLCGSGTTATDLILIGHQHLEEIPTDRRISVTINGQPCTFASGLGTSASGCGVAFGDGHVEWTTGRPVSPQTVVTAVAKQLPPALAQALPGAELVAVGSVAYAAKPDTYQAEVQWKYQGQDGRSTLALAPVRTGGTLEINGQPIRMAPPPHQGYRGQFPIKDLAPDATAAITITVDQAMDSPAPAPAGTETAPGAGAKTARPPAPGGAEADAVPASADPVERDETKGEPATAVPESGPTHWRVGSRRLAVRIVKGGVMRTLATDAAVSFRDGKLVELPRGGVIRLTERGPRATRHAELRNPDGTNEWWVENAGTWRRATPKEQNEWTAVMEGMELDDRRPEEKLRAVAAEKKAELGVPVALQALGKLAFDNEKTALLLALLDEQTLSGPDQVAIVEAVYRQFAFDAARERVLLALIARPDLTTEAKRAIADGIGRLAFDSARGKVMKALLKKPTEPAPASADRGHR